MEPEFDIYEEGGVANCTQCGAEIIDGDEVEFDGNDVYCHDCALDRRLR
jgi:hypothetical protein